MFCELLANWRYNTHSFHPLFGLWYYIRWEVFSFFPWNTERTMYIQSCFISIILIYKWCTKTKIIKNKRNIFEEEKNTYEAKELHLNKCSKTKEMHKNIKEIHYKYIANIFLKQIECSACMSLWLKYKKIRLNQNWKLAHCVNRQYRTVLKMSNFKLYFSLIFKIKGGQKDFVNNILGAVQCPQI